MTCWTAAMNDYYRLIIFDADGTLRRCTVKGQPCPNKPGEWELMPGVKEKIQAFERCTHRLGVASNQAGVALGYIAESQARQLLDDMMLKIMDGKISRPSYMIRMCPHAPDEGCNCRKPAPGMLLELMDKLQVSASNTLFVGDMESDRQAAENAGVDFMWARDFFGWNGNGE